MGWLVSVIGRKSDDGCGDDGIVLVDGESEGAKVVLGLGDDDGIADGRIDIDGLTDTVGRGDEDGV